MRKLLRVLTVVGITALVSLLAALPADMDQDGLATISEWGRGTNPLDADTDGDGLLDGDEVLRGTSPTVADTDVDGLSDGQEVELGTSPLIADVDQDGVADGAEGNTMCVLIPDCDGDGLWDGVENANSYDPLDPDTYDVGLSDSVVKAFADAGQAAGPDADKDGIPDSWEQNSGLIDWGPFSPRPGQRDLLVEYIRVTGPQSGKFSLDFSPAYDAVSQMFARESGIQIQYTETVVRRSAEHRPGFLDTDDLGYYREVIEAGAASTNPFVTTIVLNPQQEQEDLRGDVLGAAFLRSMIATVDYGAHVGITFVQKSADGITFSGSLELSPVIESHIIGARPEQIRQLQFSSGGVTNLGQTSDGQVFLQTANDGTTFTWRWYPDWFATAPNITTTDGKYLQLRRSTVTLYDVGLADTIAHELGHTLGLCHAHDESCYGKFSLTDQIRRHESTMSYNAPTGQLHFLSSEWEQVDEYLTCPPQEPVALVAAGATIDEFYDAKYEQSFSSELNLRECGDAQPVTRNFEPFDGIDRSGTGPGSGWLALHVGISVALATGLSVWWVRRA